jgi:hypothetical protein
VIEPKLDEMLKTQRSKTSELLKPHQEGHPITYHHSLFKTLQEMRSKRQSKALSDVIEDYFGQNVGIYEGTINMVNLQTRLLRSTEESDAKKHAASEAIDYVRVYYDVSSACADRHPSLTSGRSDCTRSFHRRHGSRGD